jgi:hypothetical protein
MSQTGFRRTAEKLVPGTDFSARQRIRADRGERVEVTRSSVAALGSDTVD